MNPPATLPTLCLAGPTASGKSALAMALAQHLPIEIISVDSAQVYRGMDIGTAKPSLAERAAVPHHLIDIRAPEHSYSAADFVRDTQALIPAIRARGRLPVLVGGTMLYFKALFDGLDDLPPADAAVRQQLEQRARDEGWPALHAELARIDPATAARLAPGDSQRIQRALEVWQLTGQPLSSFHTQTQRRSANATPSPWLLYALEPLDRAWLHQRINQRFAAMLAAGLLHELRQLRQRHPGLHPELPAMRCVGYRQAWQALDEHWPEALLQERGSAATRQLAKRQLTWLRGMPQRHTIAAETLAQGVPDTLLQALSQQIKSII